VNVREGTVELPGVVFEYPQLRRLLSELVGGILSGDDAAEKIAAGASLVQLYSGLIYRGPALVRECVQRLAR